MPYFFIDPPAGWIYGFPKLVKVEDISAFDLDKALIQLGYPAKENETLMTRIWEASEDDVIGSVATSLDKTR